MFRSEIRPLRRKRRLGRRRPVQGDLDMRSSCLFPHGSYFLTLLVRRATLVRSFYIKIGVQRPQTPTRRSNVTSSGFGSRKASVPDVLGSSYVACWFQKRLRTGTEGWRQDASGAPVKGNPVRRPETPAERSSRGELTARRQYWWR